MGVLISVDSQPYEFLWLFQNPQSFLLNVVISTSDYPSWDTSKLLQTVPDMMQVSLCTNYVHQPVSDMMAGTSWCRLFQRNVPECLYILVHFLVKCVAGPDIYFSTEYHNLSQLCYNKLVHSISLHTLVHYVNILGQLLQFGCVKQLQYSESYDLCTPVLKLSYTRQHVA